MTILVKKPVRVKGRMIIYDFNKMIIGKMYSVKMSKKLYLVKRISANILETYELESIKQKEEYNA